MPQPFDCEPYALGVGFVCVMCVDLHITVSLHVQNASSAVLFPLYKQYADMFPTPFSSFGGSGGVVLEHWGIAKMAAVSKGMKTVTLGYQSFHSMPCPCWALLCTCTAAHTQELHWMCSIKYTEHAPQCQPGLMSFVSYIMDASR